MNKSHHIVITAPEIVANDGRLLRQAEAIRKAGYRLSLCAPRPLGSQKDMEGTLYFPWAPPAWSKLSNGLPDFLRRFCEHRLMLVSWQKTLRSLKPDLILASAPEALKAAALSDCAPIIYDAHEYYEEEFNDTGRKQWVQKTHQTYGGSINALLTVSQGIAELYFKAYPHWPEAQLMYNTTAFKPVAIDGRLKTKAGIAADKKVILFHGYLGPYRGLDILPKLSRVLPDPYSIIIMGDGPLKPMLKTHQSSTLRIIDPVPYSELPYWIGEADIGLLLYEPISTNQLWCAPNKFFEYLALGIKIVATDLPGLRSMDQGEISFVPQKPSIDDMIIAIQYADIHQLNKSDLDKAYCHHSQINQFLDVIEKFIAKKMLEKTKDSI
jgi:glycosyltransferase involved in cell wall biosynthesis